MPYFLKEGQVFFFDAAVGEESCQDPSFQKISEEEALVITNPPQNLEQRRSDAMRRVDAFYEELVSDAIGNPAAIEKSSWPFKQQLALEIFGGNVGEIGEHFLGGLGLSSKSQQEAWAKAVLAKASKYAETLGTAEKIRAAAKSEIKSAADDISIAAALESWHFAALQEMANLKK